LSVAQLFASLIFRSHPPACRTYGRSAKGMTVGRFESFSQNLFILSKLTK